MTQQLIDGDGMARIILMLPRCDRNWRMRRQPMLAHQNADQGRDHRLGRGETEQRRVNAIAIGIALGDVGGRPSRPDAGELVQGLLDVLRPDADALLSDQKTPRQSRSPSRT